jgi:small subunit ribosomal protein S17
VAEQRCLVVPSSTSCDFNTFVVQEDIIAAPTALSQACSARAMMSLSMMNPVQLRTAAFSTSCRVPARLVSAPSRTTVVVRAVQDLKGKVVSIANNKTAVVEVVRLAPHPKYQKRTRQTKRYTAHDELGQCQIGDLVRLEGTRPLSKTKRFRVAEITQPLQ